MADKNTQEGQVQSNNMFDSEPEGNSEVVSTQHEDYPEYEPDYQKKDSQPEGDEDFIEVDGEKISTSEIDNLKSYKHFQSKFSHQQKETTEEREARIKAEERIKYLEDQLNSKKPPEKSEAPKRPDPLAPMPEGFNWGDIHDPDTVSSQWYNAKLKYDIEKDQYDRYWMDQREQKERQDEELEKAQQEFLRRKNETISQLQKVPNTTIQEAMGAFDFYNSEESLKPENMIGYFRYTKGQKPKPTKAGERVGQIQPGSTVPSEHEPKTDDAEKMFGGFGKKGADIFATK